jgi:peptide/nickel transport system ATP-binding protein
MSEAILELRGLTVEYRRALGLRDTTTHRAVDAFDLELRAGEFVALVGESGSGKSSVAKAILGLAPIAAGELRIDGVDVARLGARAARAARRPAQLVLQDPYDALDPHMTVRQIIEEPLIVHRLAGSRDGRHARVLAALESVGLSPPEGFARRRPHELSGGQRQRVCVAACLVVQPRLLIADEPVSMLDVSVRAGVLRLLDQLRARAEAAVLMVTHDLPTAAAFCDRIVVLNGGRIVEQGPARRVVDAPEHAYTRELLDATPRFKRATSNKEAS